MFLQSCRGVNCLLRKLLTPVHLDPRVRISGMQGGGINSQLKLKLQIPVPSDHSRPHYIPVQGLPLAEQSNAALTAKHGANGGLRLRTPVEGKGRWQRCF